MIFFSAGRVLLKGRVFGISPVTSKFIRLNHFGSHIYEFGFLCFLVFVSVYTAISSMDNLVDKPPSCGSVVVKTILTKLILF